MKRFRVCRHVDAVAVYETVVDADSADQGWHIAVAGDFSGSWTRVGVYDRDDSERGDIEEIVTDAAERLAKHVLEHTIQIEIVGVDRQCR